MVLKRRKPIFIISSVLIVSLMSLTNIAFGATEVTVSSPAQTETTVTLSWTKSGDWLFVDYKVKVATSVNGPYATVATISNKDTTAYAVTDLSPQSDYYFVIQDTDSLGDASSNTLQVRTKSEPVLSVTSKTQTTVSLYWNDYNTYSTQVSFNSYVIQMRTGSGQWSTLTTVTDASQSTYTVTGLSVGSYYFRLYDKVGDSGQYVSYSNTASAAIEPTPAPSTPTPTATNTYEPNPTVPLEFIIGIVIVVAVVVGGGTWFLVNRRASKQQKLS
jgi:hypothetical protein